MLREEDIRIDVGRAQHGGDFMRMVHTPTGVERSHPGPLKDVNCYELQKRWLIEIEADIAARGLLQHIVKAYRVTSTRRKRDG